MKVLTRAAQLATATPLPRASSSILSFTSAPIATSSQSHGRPISGYPLPHGVPTAPAPASAFQQLDAQLHQLGLFDTNWPRSALQRDPRLLLRSEAPSDPDAPRKPGGGRESLSDHEYQVRVGKACRVLLDSLPEFMHKGVVDLPDLEHDHDGSEHGEAPSRNGPLAAVRSRWSAAKGLLPMLSPFLGQSLLRRATWAQTSGSKTKGTPAPASGAEFDSLYHPSIAFEFRPPLPHIGIGKGDVSDGDRSSSEPIGRLSTDGPRGATSLDVYEPHPRGGPTICFNGRTMYVASSHLLRHALAALFHHTELHLESARFEGRSRPGSSWPGISAFVRRGPEPDSAGEGSWQDKLVVRLRFEGISRVSSHPHTYTVIFRYEFDRNTGTIIRHVVDNIQPVPGSKVWAGLSHAWGNLSPCGAAGGGAPGGSGPAACSIDKPHMRS